jgi:putative endonuclease
MPARDWYVYLVRCRGGCLYTGITTDVARRFAEHEANHGEGAKYLRGRGPLELVFQAKIGEKGRALTVESRVKRLSKAGKEALIVRPGQIDPIIAAASKATI